MPFAEPLVTTIHVQARQPDPHDQQLLTLLRTLRPDQREIILLVIARWASMNANTRLTLVRPNTA